MLLITEGKANCRMRRSSVDSVKDMRTRILKKRSPLTPLLRDKIIQIEESSDLFLFLFFNFCCLITVGDHIFPFGAAYAFLAASGAACV